jgi:glutathione S-transferase
MMIVQMVPVTYAIRLNEGEAQKKAVEEFFGLIKILEDGIDKDLRVEGLFIHGKEPGLLDIILGTCMTGLKRLEQMCPGIKLLDEEHVPLLCSYMEAYAELAVVKDTELMLSQYVHA